MPFTVVWLPGPLAALAQIWTGASNRQAVADAADEIDRRLRRLSAPAGAASGAVYRLRVAPLEVVYSISLADRRVEVSFVFFRP
jgi:hypothetical protein